jgi:hypothetical protein
MSYVRRMLRDHPDPVFVFSDAAVHRALGFPGFRRRRRYWSRHDLGGSGLRA